ncbi:hypothetical protein LLS1_20800 [Leifsonia sp. LS1]|uniref:hypothetical protein n=1 Tax=Leifsonia sp. LS1 TaxID=2828483 RepID=UPI001CFDB19E|nr:hypothetical protein [Leifsonia sp. LS1]GIT80411.1 hypothetical protein LLS1_20800 [Leifsonia sp. LS1]
MSPHGRRTRPGVMVGALLACVVVAVGGLGAARLPATARSEFCIPILIPCSTPTPTPTPTPSPGSGTGGGSGAPGSPLDPLLPTPTPAPGAPGSTPSAPATPAPAPTDDTSAPIFTQPPAQLGSQSLSFTGLSGIAVVNVPLADGSRVPALRISAESITIGGFSLTVRHDTGPSLATTADTMTLKGHVQVYLNSITATTADGRSLTLGADTPPPADGVPNDLLRVTLGLVGATADSIVYTNTKQHLSE